MTEWTWLGDHLAVDFANTVIDGPEGRRELIGTPAGLASWLAAEPQPLPALDPSDTRSHGRLLELRDATVRLLHAAVRGAPLPGDAVQQVNDAIARTSTLRLLGNAAGEQTVDPTRGPASARLSGVLAAAVVDLLNEERLADLAVCTAPSCGQFFHRTRPNQRWCSAGCGNRARVDRHRHRLTRRGGAG